MDARAGLDTLCSKLNNTTMIQKPSGLESGLTGDDRIEIGMAAQAIIAALDAGAASALRVTELEAQLKASHDIVANQESRIATLTAAAAKKPARAPRKK